MKKISKIFKSLFTIIMATTMVIASMKNVNAASETIQLGAARQTGSYIAGVTFSYKVTTDGQYLYCLNMHKTTAQNVQAKLVTNSRYIDGGVVYILKNGYPTTTITGDSDKDYYITQTAVWWYLDRVTGSANLGDQFKQYGSDNYGLRQYVKKLVDDGYAHRNDSITIGTTKLSLSAENGTSMTLKDGYYTSNAISATSSNISKYAITLTNAPSGTKIVTNGTESAYTEGMTINASNSFQVKVPASAVTNTTMEIKITAKATGATQYTAHEYQPVDSSMQNVALLEKETKSVSANLTLDIASSKVTIVKVDAATNQAIAGAKLVLKDSQGRTLSTWTSTINGHVVRNLANGTYTVEEIEAPTGYILNTQPMQFTISDSQRNVKVTLKNTAKKVVVNITKVDQETNAPLAGAVLVVKNSAGTEIARFTTTTDTYVLTDIANGTYTVEEVSAPEGYIKSNEIITFTVDDSHLAHQITFVNAKETPVPNTASSDLPLLIVGLMVIGLGIGFVYKNGKKAK